MKRILTSFAIFGACAISAQAQEASKEALFQEIYGLDSLLFSAFNNRDIETIKHLFSEDLEFFHDKSGLTGYDKNIELLSENFQRGSSPRRELLKETMEVYPVPGFGAVQTASHRFCHIENGEMDCGTFKFVHIWQKKDGQWKLARIVSFDH
jgi:ketosteroid isomerase-like protein